MPCSTRPTARRKNSSNGSRGGSNRSPVRPLRLPTPRPRSNAWPTRRATWLVPARNLSRSWDDDPSRLEAIETRLAHYRRLGTRFRCEPDELAARRVEIETQLAAIEQDDADLLGFDVPLAEAWKMLKQAARESFDRAAEDVQGVREGDPGPAQDAWTGQCQTHRRNRRAVARGRSDCGRAGEGGIDRVEMLFAANPGEEARPLRKVASGGELSRVMLAVKTVLAGAPTGCQPWCSTRSIPALGAVSGAILGKNLAELAEHHQIICVTHLPQMASFARLQWVIRKQVERGRTRTTITPLDDSDRVTELAAMLRGTRPPRNPAGSRSRCFSKHRPRALKRGASGVIGSFQTSCSVRISGSRLRKSPNCCLKTLIQVLRMRGK